jgi:hypothetical protein
VNRYGSRRATLRLSGRFEGPATINLRRTKITVESLLREVRGAGELVWKVVARDEPLVLVPTRGASWKQVRFEPEDDRKHGHSRKHDDHGKRSRSGKHEDRRESSRSWQHGDDRHEHQEWKHDRRDEHPGHEGKGHGKGGEPLSVTLKRVHDGLELRVSVPRSSISAPQACSDKPSETILETSLLLDDGRGSPQRLVFEAPWECSLHARRLSLRYTGSDDAPVAVPGKPGKSTHADAGGAGKRKH